MKILVSANSCFNLTNFRMGLIHALRAKGHEVVCLAPFDDHTRELQSQGLNVVELVMDPRGVSPLGEAATLARAYRKVRKIRPDAILSFTIKNNLYLGLAGSRLNIPVFPNITGLGTVFADRPILRTVLRQVYNKALKSAPVVFFQNSEDRSTFVEQGVVTGERAALLPGSGVDLERFKHLPLPAAPDAPVFLLVARLLWSKGIGEFLEAARTVRKKYPKARFEILGAMEVSGADAIGQDDIKAWKNQDGVSYLGTTRDVRPTMARADCVVLPSYYKEGTPRTLLEAAALGRPLITTDTAGCRDVVEDGVTGYLVPPRDASSLAQAMLRLADATPEQRSAMGRNGRKLVERRYDERLVIDRYLTALGSVSETEMTGEGISASPVTMSGR